MGSGCLRITTREAAEMARGLPAFSPEPLPPLPLLLSRSARERAVQLTSPLS